MRQLPSSPNNARKRVPHQPKRDAVWRIVEPSPPRMLTVDEVAEADAADLARQQRAPRRPRPPQQCTIGYGYYAASQQRVPTLRLRGRWLEQLGFVIGSKLDIRMRDGELVVSLARKDLGKL
ncbi:SymE family type I addiction module toxin [Xanthomonas hortorum]|uniref:SymE family type I addiction module toxin n=1 Tax=Xanthomonas hortorum TaxID=56454 RepID=UPI002B263F49|nr:SymE family type I addiction module toxin [Xanthomonas hortorum]WOB36789.1 type I toxin-antitoxin system SymE family toxin [Xanthomonas hortorum pv. pelargonii]